jgi:hypothetical protein
MNTRQILKYAKDNGFDSVMFCVKNGSGTHICVGKFLDAYYEFVTIPFLGDGFVRISTLEEQLGYDIQFEEIDKKTYSSGVFLDFVLRGKDVPKSVSDDLKSELE